MIIGLTMQHPSGAALPSMDRLQKPVQLNINEQGNEGIAQVEDVSTPYQLHDQVNLTAQHQLINPAMHRFMDEQLSSQLHQQQQMIGHLESQFGQFSIQNQEQQGTSEQFDSSDHNSISENNNVDDIEGEEADEEPVKLFVGQVPKTLNEEDIFPTFDVFGPLKDVSIIRDKHTGIHRGCAFVTYWSAVDAERAREALHDTLTFAGAKRAAQVKPAEPSAVPENKLFIGMLSRKAGEQEVRELFSSFGEIREIHMIRNSDGTSKCAAFLRYQTREAAVQAMEQLNGNTVMEGAARPLIVKFADNKHQRQQRHFRSIRRQEMMTMVGPTYSYPQVQGAPPMIPVAGPGPYSIPPSTHYPTGPYVPQAVQIQQPPHPGAHPHNPFMYAPHFPPHGTAFTYPAPRPEVRPTNPRPREGPAGANLFVYHLPHDLTDADLATAFNHFGTVISAKVYVDKYTGESKGFGFVSYDSVMAAAAAIEQMNGFQIGNKRLKVQHKRIHGEFLGMREMEDASQELEHPTQANA